MDSVILGLLMLSPMTGYEIGCFIKQKLPMICSSSAGSMQTSLKKLNKLGLITFQESVKNGKNKKIFSISETGKDEFMNWLENPMRVEKVKNMELSKLFFLGFASKEEQIKNIEIIIMQLEIAIQTLTIIKKEFESMDLEQNDITLFQGYTLDYGIDSAKFQQDWYQKLKEKVEKQK
ncbi:PadR family transcriptional regulator [Tannockella kyphosi]|uniref:PadR family transcriptional regulator n=1 Tax=Tannockella kyphosi TaxID=2899121 RepID=UPI0020122C6B|nr:PadR family transcriptional regulator [Tannockella kyphosi]